MFKTCPSCRAEFLAHVSECPDCRVTLRHDGASDVAAPALAAMTRETDASEAVALASPILLRSGEVAELRELAERLLAAGLTCAIDTDPPGVGITGTSGRALRSAAGRDVRLAIYVEHSERELAITVHESWMAESVPGAERAGPIGALEACPGCDEPLAPNAAGCASCGLEFPEMQASCPSCGQAVAADADRCASCGHRP